MKTRALLEKNFKHFNAASTVDAAKGWIDLLNKGGKMFLAMAGAMSTAEIGISLAEMIRKDKVHAICTTGANLEEDIFNLVAHKHYHRIPNYRSLTKKDETALMKKGLNRVTDTCIPEERAFRHIERIIYTLWKKADDTHKRFFPYEYIYQLLDHLDHYEIDPKNSWVLAAKKEKIPIYTPGWEDSTLGNIFVAHVLRKELSSYSLVKSGLEQMANLVDWYKKSAPAGFFQIGGGIAGDFPICVVPLIKQDLKQKAPYWSYFCQISDSTTSYGSYSGAVPNEKITWGKVEEKTPTYIIESDASIVAPLIFNYVLDT